VSDRDYPAGVMVAGGVFKVTPLASGDVRLAIHATETDIEIDMRPDSAAWLAWELAKAAQLPWPPALRIVRRESS